MAVTNDIREVLESFLLSEDLFELESRFARFNVFEALGVARREVNHSNFLAYLLNPSESHGLRGLFLQRFLQEATRQYSDSAVSVAELDCLDLSHTTIRREYQNIDVLLTDHRNKIVAVIENKVDSKQHDNQLERYYQEVAQAYPDYRFVGVYLTQSGEESRHSQYVSLSYANVRALVNKLLARENVLLLPTFRIVLEQYSDLLGKRFMADTELSALCARIYKQHKQAIDILRKNLPDSLDIALETIKTLVETSGFVLLGADSNAVRFIPKSFDISFFKSETAWLSPSANQMVYLECKRKNDSLVFQAKMDGGTLQERTAVHGFAARHNPPFKVDKSVYDKYQVLYSRVILEESSSDMKDEEVVSRLTAQWKDVMKAISNMSDACLTLNSTSQSASQAFG